jgi:predicted nucleic acid-binding protein
MMAVDTSSLAAYFLGEQGPDVDAIDLALDRGTLFLPCVCHSELLSSPRLPKDMAIILQTMPTLYPNDHDFWQRVGRYRHDLMKSGKKARLADTMIAALCIDYHIPFLTRDRDFRHFIDFGLILL